MRWTAGWSRALVTLLLTGLALAHVWDLLRIPALDWLDRGLYDARVRAHAQAAPSDRIVILDVDEASLEKLGRWPWPRGLHARLLDQLFDVYGIRALGLDFTLPDAGIQDAATVLNELQHDPRLQEPPARLALAERRAAWDHNARLARALQERNVVVGYVFKDFVGDDEPVATGELPTPALQGQSTAQWQLPFVQAQAYTGVFADFLQAGVTAGYVSNPSSDPDGSVRRAPLLMAFDEQLYASFALELARVAIGRVQPGLRFADGAPRRDSAFLEGVSLGERVIPVDERLNVLIPYRGRMGSFPYLSYADVLAGRVPFESLFDKIVIVGTTAAGLPDVHSTPVGSRYAGVEIHASIVDGLLAGGLKASPLYLRGLQTLVLIALAVLVFLLASLPLTLGVTGLGTLGFGLHLAGVLAWRDYDLDLPLATSIALVIALYAIQFLILSARQIVQRNALVRVFGQYIPNRVARELNRDTGSLTLDGESREMSVLFTDVRGFTSIAEGFDPHELTELMNAFLTPVTEVIHRKQGTIDKYMGDAVMAFWGAPLQDRRHANNAVSAGLAMIWRLAELRPEFSARGWPELKMGVGINTGKMHVGNMGSQFRVAYTVLGDAVNLGSRLEGLTKAYGVQLIVSEATMTQATWFVYRELDMVRVKGKAEPVRIYEPQCDKQAMTPQMQARLQQWHAALAAYRARDWPAARQGIEQLGTQTTLHRIYLERIAHFESNPPGPDWDGVFEHTSK